jgi:hypothetical protein
MRRINAKGVIRVAVGGKAVLVFWTAVVGLAWSLLTGNIEEAKLFGLVVASGIVLTAIFNGGRALVNSATRKDDQGGV